MKCLIHGVLMMKAKKRSANRLSLVGRRFGRLVVVSEVPEAGRYSRWNCRCDCGVELVVVGRRLTDPKEGRKSCGCLQKEAAKALRYSHGMSETRVYKIWCSMKNRCTCDTAKDYHRYGGRGITICDEWMDSFEKFYADMGDPPSEDHSIERRDVNGHYTKDNCIWTLPIEQANNRADTVFLTHNGETRSRRDWARLLNISPDTIRSRMQRGRSVSEALTGTKE